ncbi:hypothetical protein HDE_11460 [Halotydeus destructor]|nr:hypothetical protein HDE_11460 [Halotydeus destructor]
MNSSLLLISAYLFINSNLIESIKLSSQQTGGADVCQANSKTINGIIKLDDNSFYAFFDFGRYVTKVDGFRQDGAGQPIVSPGFPQPSSILWPNVLTEHSNERLVAAFSSANEQVTFVKRSHNGEFVVLKYTGFKATSQLSMATLYKDYVNGTHVKKVTYYNGQLWLVVREPAFVTVAIGNNNVTKKVNGRENVRERSIAQLEVGEAILLQGSFWAHLPSNLDIGPLMAYDNYATGVEMKGNDLWLGCPARFCHDGQVDAATTLGGQVLLFRGKYRYLAKSFQDIPAAAAILNQLDEKTNYIADAAFTIKETLYVVRDQGAHAYADGQLGPLMELEGLGGVDYVNGALFDSSTQNIYLFYKSWFAIYRLDEHNKFEKVQWFEKVTKFKGLPGNLDAAVIVSGSIFFFKGNFYYTMAEPELISGGNVQGPVLDARETVQLS